MYHLVGRNCTEVYCKHPYNFFSPTPHKFSTTRFLISVSSYLVYVRRDYLFIDALGATLSLSAPDTGTLVTGFTQFRMLSFLNFYACLWCMSFGWNSTIFSLLTSQSDLCLHTFFIWCFLRAISCYSSFWLSFCGFQDLVKAYFPYLTVKTIELWVRPSRFAPGRCHFCRCWRTCGTKSLAEHQ